MPANSADDIEFKFTELHEKLEEGFGLSAQGREVIRVIYPPEQEKEYLQRLEEEYEDEAFINIADLFVEMIDDYGFDNFKRLYEDYSSEVDKIFQSESEYDPNLFERIMSEIVTAGEKGNIPFLVRTGVLYGTGIRANKIIEDQRVFDLDNPLVIFYPAKETEGHPLFLNDPDRPTSEYAGETI